MDILNILALNVSQGYSQLSIETAFYFITFLGSIYIAMDLQINCMHFQLFLDQIRLKN